MLGVKDSVDLVRVTEDSEVEISRLNGSTGSLISTSVIAAPWLILNTSRYCTVLVEMYLILILRCMLTTGVFMCVDWESRQFYWAALESDTPSFQSSPLESHIQLTTPTLLCLHPTPSGHGLVWLKDAHTSWLLRLEGDSVTVGSKVEVGVALVGNVDMSGTSDGEEVDIRVERRGEDRIVLTYHHSNGRKDGGTYVLKTHRGRPLQASA